MGVTGEIRFLKPRERDLAHSLSNARSSPENICDHTLLLQLSRLAIDGGVQTALLLGRDGRVQEVILGTRERLYLPELSRSSARGGRLRGVRLIVCIPFRGETLRVPHDFLTDLEKLRLDLLTVVGVPDGGELDLERLQIMLYSLTATGRGRNLRVGVASEEIGCEALEGGEVLDRIADIEEQIKSVASELHSVGKGGALLVGAYTGAAKEAEASMSELLELADTAGIPVVDTVVQRRRKLDPRSVLGKGKLEELVLYALDREVELLVFDGELSPGQLRAITNLTELKIIDRSMLILDIFAQRARSSEGRLQVELAQLKYSLPRLTEGDSGLSRLSGGIGGRGPGETKLEISRRRARDKITDLERRIEQVSKQREVQRSRRQQRGVPVVALVGYTNAGKSTLLNALTKSNVFAEDKLFATLDTSSRRMRFPNEREVIFVDTVGFIRDLPSELVTAFKATLEEVLEANLLLHVTDASNPNVEVQIEAVEKTLHELGAGERPQVLIYNKCDLVSELELGTLQDRRSGIEVSAMTRRGLGLVLEQCQVELLKCFSGEDPGGFISRPIGNLPQKIEDGGKD